MLVPSVIFLPSPIFHPQPFSQLTKGITNAKLLKWAEEPLKDEPVCMVGDAWDMLNSGWAVAAFNTADKCMSRCGGFVWFSCGCTSGCARLHVGHSVAWDRISLPCVGLGGMRLVDDILDGQVQLSECLQA